MTETERIITELHDQRNTALDRIRTLEAENEFLREDLERLKSAAQTMHDECSILANGKRLNLGPMMEPREHTVLKIRRILDSLH